VDITLKKLNLMSNANTLSIDGIKTNIIEKNIGKSFLGSISFNKKEKTKN